MNRHMSVDPNTPTTSSITPRTVQEDIPVSTTPTTTNDTTTAAAVPTAPQARVWFYWITYSFPTGNGSTECSFPARVTHGTQLLEIAQQLAQLSSTPKVSVDGFTLLRVEDAAGQVIG